MIEVSIYLKTGQTMFFECEAINICKNELGHIAGYTIMDGESKSRLSYLDTEQIAGITVRDLYNKRKE